MSQLFFGFEGLYKINAIPTLSLSLGLLGIIGIILTLGRRLDSAMKLERFGIPIALLVGAIGFLITGSFLKANLPLSVGFINIPAFLIFIQITMYMARVGANTVHKLDKSKLQRFFGIFLYVIGTIFLYIYLSI